MSRVIRSIIRLRDARDATRGETPRMASNVVEPQPAWPQYAAMEARIAKLEAHAEHVIVDLRELRTDLRDLRKTVDQHFHVLLGAITGVAGLIAKGFHRF